MTAVKTATALAVLLLSALLLLAAFVAGQDRQCTWMRQHQPLHAAAYCSGSPR